MLDGDFGPVSERWNGPRWRWWSLLAGTLLIPVTALVAGVFALISGDRLVPILLLLLVLEILVASMVGSGLLDSVSGRMNRGGLAREATDFVDGSQLAADRKTREEENRIARDRRTIRAGIFVVPLIAAFVFLMMRL